MLSKLKQLLKTGFFHIVGAGAINKVISMLLSIVLVRILSKTDYGCYAYAFNIVSFFVLFNGLGVPTAILQICSENYKDKLKSFVVYRYAFKGGIAVDMTIAILILAVALFVPLAVDGSNVLLALYSLYPFVSLLCEMRLMRLRVNLENRVYARMTNIQTLLLALFSVTGALICQAVGLIVGQCLAYCASYLLLTYAIKESKKDCAVEVSASELSKSEKVDFWKIATISSFNNGLGGMLTLVGTQLIGILIANAEIVASYKVATTIPFALLFLPSAIITYVYPYFARNKNDRRWTLKNYGLLLLGSGMIFLIVFALCEILAEPIICIIFGDQYLDSVPCFRILMLGFFVTSTLRMPTGNLLVTQRRLFANTLMGVLSIAFNVFLSFILIPSYGMIGAAWVYVLTMVLGTFICVPIFIATAGKPRKTRGGIV